jgi:hypothetical protein
MKKQGTTDAKRLAANDKQEISGDIQGSAELVSEAEVPTTSRAQKGVFLETPEWKAGIAKVAAGIPAGKAVRIVMSSETQQSIKNARICFKRALMGFLKRQKLNYETVARQLPLLKAAGETARRNTPPFASDLAPLDASPGAAVQRSGAEGALTWGSEEPVWSILTSI